MLKNGPGVEGCQLHVVSRTASEITTTGTCSLGGEGTTNVESHSNVVSPEAFTMSSTVTTSIGYQTMCTEMETKAKWLESSCGDVKE